MRRWFASGCGVTVETPTRVNYAQPSLSPSTLLRDLSEEMGQINVPPLLSPCCVSADSQQPDKMFSENEEAPNYQANYAPKLYEYAWPCENDLDLAIHENLRESELKFPSINMDSPELSQRPFLVNFLNHISDCLQLANSTRYLAVRLLDGFMDKHSIMTYRLKLVSLTCLHIAIKFEDVDYSFPSMNTLLKLGGQEHVELEEFHQMEIYILTFYDWKISYPTHIHFIDFYILNSISKESLSTSDNTLQQCAYSFLDFTLTDNNFIQFVPSQVAAASVLAARVILNLEPNWSPVMENLTGYTAEDLQPLSLIMQQHLEEIHSVVLTPITTRRQSR